MSISVPTNSASTSSIGVQQLKSDQSKAVDDLPTPQAVEQLMARSDLAVIQLSQLQALALSLGQANPVNFAKPSGPHSVQAPSSTMDLYA